MSRTTWKVAMLIAALLTSALVSAAPADAPAKEASIRELLTLMQTSKLLDNISTQLDGVMQSSMQQALAGKQISSEQQAILDDMRGKMVKIFSDDMQWNQLEPMFIDIYQKTFSQSEVEGMLKFYKTDAGRALIAKMPLAMQNSMQAMQAKMAPLMQQVQQLQRETIEKLHAAKVD